MEPRNRYVLKDIKPEDLNPKAKEAFAKSLIDNGVAIFKAILLTILILPITLIIKTETSQSSSISVIEVLGSMSSATFILLLSLISVGFVSATYLRSAGVKLLHEMEQQT